MQHLEHNALIALLST